MERNLGFKGKHKEKRKERKKNQTLTLFNDVCKFTNKIKPWFTIINCFKRHELEITRK